MSDEELALLCDDDWPGNVRELKMAIVRAAHLYGPTLRAQDVLEHSARLRRQTDDVISVKGRRLADIERDILTTALRHAGGNQRLAAEQLALPKSSLSDRLRKLGIVTARQVVADK
jgi:DNA-binding NtrC family response regulator